MNRTLVVSALLAIALTACGKKEQAPVPATANPAPAAEAPKPADTPATAPAAPVTPAEKKPEQKN